MMLFPHIETIDDVLPALKNREEFFIADKGDHIIINYTHITPNTFPVTTDPTILPEHALILRECRGIAFYPNGKIMSRPFHKFFNFDEKPETSVSCLSGIFENRHYYLEKLDGTMVRPIFSADPSLWLMGTKMGITDTSKLVDEYIQNTWNLSDNSLGLYDFIMQCYDMEVTPLFEWCSRKSRIVLDYPEDRLVLMAMRNKISGVYWNLNCLKEFACQFKLDVVKAFKHPSSDITDVVNEIRNEEQNAGYVLTWDNGHRIQIKSDWYVFIHKIKDSIRLEKDIFKIILDDKIDDLLPILNEEEKNRILVFQNNILNCISSIANYYDNVVYIYRDTQGMTTKEFALRIVPNLEFPSVAFNIFHKKMHPIDAVKSCIKKQCSTGTQQIETFLKNKNIPRY